MFIFDQGCEHLKLLDNPLVNKVLMVPIFLPDYFTLPTILALMICTPL